MPYINIHTHQAKAPGSVLMVANLMAGELCRGNFSNCYSLGIHPWQLQSVDPDMIIDFTHYDNSYVILLQIIRLHYQYLHYYFCNEDNKLLEI